MFQRAWIVAAMMTFVAASSDAGAAPGAGRSQKPGQAGDGKGSGKVLKKLDADKDGQISKSEFEAAKTKAASRGKGKAGAKRGKVFDRLDSDGDGSLSATELKKLQELRSKRPGGAKTGQPK